MWPTKAQPWYVRWSGYSALLALVIIGASVLLVRAGWWQPGLMIYALACLGSSLLFVLLLVLLLIPALRGWRRTLFTGLICTLPGLLLTVSIVGQRGDYPPIHDISTDLEDPPRFERAPALRGPDANPLQRDPGIDDLQARAYPQVTTLRTPLQHRAAFERASDTVEELGWKTVYSDPGRGRIEAVARTPVMGFRDDVVVRLRPSGDGTAIDLRSVSRVGVSDLGANAERIMAFKRDFREQR